MSAVDIRRDAHGVVLRYRTDIRPGHIGKQKAQRSDRERLALIEAERSALNLRVIAEALHLSDFAMDRIDEELSTIRESQRLTRAALGLAPRAAE